jgi:hypothetical protein
VARLIDGYGGDSETAQLQEGQQPEQEHGDDAR